MSVQGLGKRKKRSLGARIPTQSPSTYQRPRLAGFGSIPGLPADYMQDAGPRSPPPRLVPLQFNPPTLPDAPPRHSSPIRSTSTSLPLLHLELILVLPGGIQPQIYLNLLLPNTSPLHLVIVIPTLGPLHLRLNLPHCVGHRLRLFLPQIRPCLIRIDCPCPHRPTYNSLHFGTPYQNYLPPCPTPPIRHPPSTP